MAQKNFVPRNTAFKDQLSKLLPGTDRSKPHHHKKGGKFNQPMAAPKGKDGVDHLNIFEGAVTDLGKCLSHSNQLRFQHKLYGGFSNIESFWYYIRTEEHDDRVRKLTGNKLKVFADEMTPRRVKNFMAIILDANWQRICQYPELKAAVKENTLPFECYSYLKRQDGIRQRPPHAHWMMPLFEEISLALKEDREPNLTKFLDDQKIGLYDDVFPKKETDDPDLTGAIVEEAVVAAQEPVRNPGLGALLNRPVEQVAAVPAAVVEEAVRPTVIKDDMYVQLYDIPAVLPVSPITAAAEVQVATPAIEVVVDTAQRIDGVSLPVEASEVMLLNVEPLVDGVSSVTDAVNIQDLSESAQVNGIYSVSAVDAACAALDAGQPTYAPDEAHLEGLAPITPVVVPAA